MRNAFLSFFVFVILACAVAFSETELKLSEIQRRDFSTISVDDARILADKAGKTEDGDIPHEFVRAAIKSGRLELMDICWETLYVSAYFSEEYRKMPDGHLKDQLFSRSLRNPRIPWPDDKPGETSSGNGTERMSLKQYYIPILRKYLPDLSMNYSEIGSREKRLKLADVFDEAVGIPIVVEPEARRIGPLSRPPKHEAPSVLLAGPPAAGASTVATAPGGEAGSFRGRSFVWFALLAAALVGAAAWLFLRLRRQR